MRRNTKFQVDDASINRMTQSESYRSQLDGLRFYAVLLVFASHALSQQHIIPILGAGLTTHYVGIFGVLIFFAISGFLITKILLESESGDLFYDLKRFYIRRLLRIIPLYYLYLTILVVAGLLKDPLPFYFFTYNLRAFFGDTTLWTGAWSLCIEEQFYILYPLILLTTNKSLRMFLLVGLLILCNAVQFICDRTITDYYYRSVYLLPMCAHYLLFGAIFALMQREETYKRFLPSAGKTLIVGLIFMILTLVAHMYHDDFDFVAWNSTIVLVQAFSLACVVSGVWRLENKWALFPFNNRFAVFIGKISYAFYLLQGLFFLIVIRYIGLKVPFIFDHHVLVTFLITTGFSTLSYYFWERPFNRLKEKFPYENKKAEPSPESHSA